MISILFKAYIPYTLVRKTHVLKNISSDLTVYDFNSIF